MKRLLALLVLTPLAVTAPGVAAPGTTTVLDRPNGFGALPYDGAADSSVSRHALSANGCYVVFWSDTDDLAAGDDDGAENVYRQDLCDPGTPPRQVNTSSAGVPAAGGTFASNPTISADGRYVAFQSNAANLDPAARGASAYVFRKDMQTGALTLVSRSDGTGGAPVSSPRFPIISGNGQAVLFIAGAAHAFNADGVAGDTDAYVRYPAAGRTYMASVKDGGGEGGGLHGTRFTADLDYRGVNVAFVTDHKLDAGDADATDDVYERQGIGTISQHTLQVSFSGTSQVPGADSGSAVAISSDASRVAYTNGRVWVSTCSPCGAAKRVDAARTGGDDTGPHYDPFFAQTGDNAPARVFWHTVDALDPADHNADDDLYSAALQGADPIRLVTTGTADAPIAGGDATDDLSRAVFVADSATNLPGSDGIHRETYEVIGGTVHDLRQVGGGTLRTSEVDNSLLFPRHAASDDGRLGVFVTLAPALGAPFSARRHVPQAVARDTATARTLLVSAAPDGITAADRDVESVSVDAAGRHVAFDSDASNLITGAPNGIALHVYVRDLVTRTTTLVDRAANGMPAALGAQRPQLSGDGHWIVFESSSPDLPGAPQDGEFHVYRVRLSDGATQLADRTAAGVPGDNAARDADVSFDGRRVSFDSQATNLGGPASGYGDVYVHDFAAGTTTWASIHSSAVAQQAFEGALSGDGTRVAFVTENVGGPDENPHVAVRDLVRRTTAPALPSVTTDLPSLSRDGRSIAFQAELPGGRSVTFVRDLATGTLTRPDLRDRSTVPGRLGSYAASIAGNGRCVLFLSDSDDLTSPGYGANYFHVYRRCAGTTPPAGVRDTTPPAITGLHMTHRRFRPHRRATAFVFRLSEAASTRITVRTRHGRRRAVLKRPGTIRGRDRIVFSGRVHHRALHPGRYRATVVATDRAGNRSRPASVRFTVVRRHRS